MEFVYAVGLLSEIDIFMTRSGMPILKFYLYIKGDRDRKVFCEYPLKKGFSYNIYNKLLNLKWRKTFIKGSIRNNGNNDIRIFVKNMLLFKSDNNYKNGFSYVFYLINKDKEYTPYVKDNKLYIQRLYKSKYFGQEKKAEEIYIPIDVKIHYEGKLEKIYVKGILKNGIIFTDEIGVSGD